ncbi:ArsR/SmtB family transcription factor [Nitratireductor indicus]|uniref:ArsR/SmtB family transcription factor n=1 Tax=Nitratireductor indicus TaxID=721133 RepID=UPI002876CAB2|nr:helix-turn-helix domain-containing protein [Nitratireductor indicus]MDS1137485.1 helix-turn-helix domain-containing protein [Nitratireductor indicus]
MNSLLPEPNVEDLDLATVLAALADPHRLNIALALAAAPETVLRCAAFDIPVTKATRTHHFRVLREAGIIRQHDHGNGRSNQLRLADLRQRFPGLVEMLLAEQAERGSAIRDG